MNILKEVMMMKKKRSKAFWGWMIFLLFVLAVGAVVLVAGIQLGTPVLLDVPAKVL